MKERFREFKNRFLMNKNIVKKIIDECFELITHETYRSLQQSYVCMNNSLEGRS